MLLRFENNGCNSDGVEYLIYMQLIFTAPVNVSLFTEHRVRAHIVEGWRITMLPLLAFATSAQSNLRTGFSARQTTGTFPAADKVDQDIVTMVCTRFFVRDNNNYDVLTLLTVLFASLITSSTEKDESFDAATTAQNHSFYLNNNS